MYRPKPPKTAFPNLWSTRIPEEVREIFRVADSVEAMFKSGTYFNLSNGEKINLKIFFIHFLLYLHF